jgi:hypothetical protein
MFLKKLYKYNKIFCISFVFIILLFCFLNYKRGMVMAPIFQYGMYSGIFNLNDTQSVYKIYVNNKELDLTKYSFEKNDEILVSIGNYEKTKKSNAIIFETIRRIMGKIGMSSFMTVSKFSNNISDQDFMLWYKKMLEKMISNPIEKIEIFSQKMLWQEDAIKAVSSPIKLFSIAAHK